ncbi:MAG TPA: sigma-70 family RNA polymerase sigma factor [Polyangia bacterium]|jgi:RNA polymerase sigma-70 factor (ECF subfamily)|nr:sigma-70 family RNA polymerase sigma factor [Polyangia bacterium]
MAELPASTLAACRRGDAHAFRALVECYQDRVYALCVALAGRADAEDLAQETFLRVHQAIGRFAPDGPATLGGWILTIARRLCHDRARSARLRVEVAVGAGLETAAATRNPEEAAQGASLVAALHVALAALPEEQRAVFALREWDGLEYEEIAAVEGVPVGTVRSRLARAREALRTALGERAGGAAKDLSLTTERGA